VLKIIFTPEKRDYVKVVKNRTHINDKGWDLNFDDASWALNPIIILAGLKRIWALAQIFSLVFYISFIFFFYLFIFSLYENITIYDLPESELNWQNKVTSSSPFTPLNSIVSSIII